MQPKRYCCAWSYIIIITWCRFVRGDQYAIALGLLDEGKVVLGVLACPNLPLGSVNSKEPQGKVGCLFSAQIGGGTYMQSLDGSPPVKVDSQICFYLAFVSDGYCANVID